MADVEAVPFSAEEEKQLWTGKQAARLTATLEIDFLT